MRFCFNNSMKEISKGIIAIISGGIDSTTMLWELQGLGYIIKEVLTFNYGQRHTRELKAAKDVIEYFTNSKSEITHKIVDISNIQYLMSAGALTGDEDVPKDIYNSETQRITIVPNRNMIFISIAAARAITLNVPFVAYAAHNSDYEVYPDCRPEFISKMDEALNLANLWTPVKLIAPFKDITKAEIVKRGLKLGAPLNITWSCYEGQERPCLECGTCLERTEAFYLNSTSDPSLKDGEWIEAVKLLRKYINKI